MLWRPRNLTRNFDWAIRLQNYLLSVLISAGKIYINESLWHWTYYLNGIILAQSDIYYIPYTFLLYIQ